MEDLAKALLMMQYLPVIGIVIIVIIIGGIVFYIKSKKK
jgi:hypothetical protein